MAFQYLMLKNFKASLKQPAIALSIAIACIGSAVFLRAGHGILLREHITRVLGYKWRAAIEHLLSGIGIPLAVGVFFLTVLLALCWASYSISKWAKWTWEPLAKHPARVVSFDDLRRQVNIWSAVYALSAVIWEYSQAFIGVYGGGPRGYVQWEQLLLDIGGAIIAICAVRYFLKPN